MDWLIGKVLSNVIYEDDEHWGTYRMEPYDTPALNVLSAGFLNIQDNIQ